MARREVLALQAANQELQGVVDRLRLQNEQLAARVRDAEAGGAGGGSGSAGPSPAKRHVDPALLQAMLRKRDG